MSDPTSDRTGEGYERIEVRPRPILLFGVLLALGVAAALAASGWVAAAFTDSSTAARTPRHPMGAEPTPSSGPALQAAPSAELVEHRRREAQRLETYGWVDPEAGLVRIPIDRAIELVAERGLAARPGTREGNR